MNNKNADMPAMPTVGTENGTEPTYGLTKREHFASTLPHVEFSATPDAIERLLGRKINFNDVVDAMVAAAEIEAKFRVIRADALLEELEKTKCSQLHN